MGKKQWGHGFHHGSKKQYLEDLAKEYESILLETYECMRLLARIESIKEHPEHFDLAIQAAKKIEMLVSERRRQRYSEFVEADPELYSKTVVKATRKSLDSGPMVGDKVKITYGVHSGKVGTVVDSEPWTVQDAVQIEGSIASVLIPVECLVVTN